jgi:hypothetical protein
MLFLSTLGPFQKNVVIVACVVLLVVLAVIAYYLSEGSSTQQWPPSVSNCPDYWEDQDGQGKQCFNVQRLGKCGIGPYDLTNWNKPRNACEAKGIMENCKLTWDGITSVDACSETYEKRAKKNGTW